MMKKYGITFIGLFLLAILLIGAFAVPDMVNRIYDSRTLGQLNTREINLKTYELTYNSFEEKLHTIGMALSEGATIELMELMEDTSSYQAITNEELAEFARQEVELLLNEGLGMDIEILPDRLYERRLFTVFGKSQGNNENILSGIHVYKLSFEVSSTSDRGDIALALYMDAEFHKLYAFAVDNASPYMAEIWLATQKNVPETMADYWEIEQEYAFVNPDEEQKEATYYENGSSSWGVWDETTLVFEDDARIYLWRAMNIYKYATSMNMGIEPFVYSY